MEEYQKVKHICKFCYKSFVCGRSLGGHMRSHLSNTVESAEKMIKKKLSNLTKYDHEEAGFKDDGAQIAYSLREIRKKNSKFANSNGDSYSLDDKFCKVCGEEFLSWKAFFGHMKRHSDKLSNTFDDYTLNSGNVKAVMVFDSQSDNEFAAPIRKQRSSRTFKRYQNSDTLSVTNALQSVSEIEQEQEEVALSLILLSMDTTFQKGDLKSIADSSDNNNLEFQEDISNTKSESKTFSCSENKLLNSKSLSSIDMELDSTHPLESSSMLGVAIFKDSLIKKVEVEDRNESHLKEFEVGLVNDHDSKLSTKKHKSIKRKHNALDHHSQEISANGSMKLDCDDICESKVIEYLGYEKKIKFECTSCDKTFHSYQALGGHRASHKKKASLEFDTDSPEISIVTVQNLVSSNASIKSSLTSMSCNIAIKSVVTSKNLEECKTTTSKLVVTSQNLGSDSATMSIPRPPRVFDPKFKSRKVIVSDGGFKKLTNSDHGLSKKHNKLHECPLCFKVFPSGQAFGGHKRYHLLTEAKKNINKQNEKTDSSVINDEEQIPEKIRDFLDLNLPAPEHQEEISGPSNPWWMASNLKRQSLHVGPF